MELRIWVDDGDLDDIIEASDLETEQDVLDELSEAITEWAGAKWGIILNTETEE